MTAPIGPDWASVDRNNTPNLTMATSAGARFAGVRSIYGRGGPSGGAWRDPCWERDATRIVGAGLKRFTYAFLCFPVADPNVHTPTPEAQMDELAAYVQLVTGHDFVPFIDVEEQSTLAPPDYLEWIKRAARRAREHFGAWPGLYFSDRVWIEYVGSLDPGELIDCPPWIAKPWPLPEKSTIDLTGAPASMPKCHPAWGDNNWWLYQYQGDALRWPGFNSTVDASRFRVSGLGASGAHVAWMQRRLNSWGASLTVDGSFGPLTQIAVKKLQSAHGLTPDGIVGMDTFAVLCWLP